MTDRNGVIKGLKDQECEKGMRVKRPPIAYVPVVDEVQEQLALNRSEKGTEKVKMPNGTTINAGVWFSGTPEQFLNHVTNTLNYITRKGLFTDHATAFQELKKARSLRDQAESDLHAANEADVEADVIAGLKKSRDAAAVAEDTANEKCVTAAKGIFSLYSNLLSVEQRISWENVVEQQTDKSPWTDLKGKKRVKAWPKSE